MDGVECFEKTREQNGVNITSHTHKSEHSFKTAITGGEGGAAPAPSPGAPPPPSPEPELCGDESAPPAASAAALIPSQQHSGQSISIQDVWECSQSVCPRFDMTNK